MDDKQYIQERIEIDKKTGCWNWKLSVGSHGYGNTKYARLNSTYSCAHRLSYFAYKGDIGNYHVLHKCDNRRCCNPQHLYLGTVKDNVNDMIMRGRNRNGNRMGIDIGTAKLTEEQVKQIKVRLKNGESPNKIAKDYPVSRDAIYHIKWERRWKHIKV